jgi:predicted flavoprotein YhiN
MENFVTRYDGPGLRWQELLADFSPDDLRRWAMELGVETFVGTSHRVFPVDKHAAPLLRRWVERLRKQGVSFRPQHQLTALRPAGKHWEVELDQPGGRVKFQCLDKTVRRRRHSADAFPSRELRLRDRLAARLSRRGGRPAAQEHRRQR